MTDTADVQAIPAATLILLRPRVAAPPEVLMVERSGALAFAGGMLVFPGGRIDAADRAVAADPALCPAATTLDDADAVARVAAIRETIEEAGIAVGLGSSAPATVAALRRSLAAGTPFGSLLGEAGLHLDLTALVPFTRWRPGVQQARTFDTRFYVATAGADAVAEPDGSESVRAVWAGAAELLAGAAAGLHGLIFPTRCTLDRLAAHGSIDEIHADTQRHPAQLIVPEVQDRDGEIWVHLPAGHGYRSASAPIGPRSASPAAR